MDETLNGIFTHCAFTRTEKPVRSTFAMHAHNNNEIFCFLAGDAEYYVEGNCYPLLPGDIMLMRKSESHHLILNSERPYERMVLNFDLPFLRELDPEGRLMAVFNDRPLGQFNHYSVSLFPDNRWMFYLNKICESNDSLTRVTYLLPLLSELSECFETVKNAGPQEGTRPVPAIVQYINQHLTEKLSLSSICERFYMSKAQMNRIFKENTGSTVWNYITVKRLLLAQEMLKAGKMPTEVYTDCGFKDYTTFFRAYKKKFEVSPRGDQSR